MVYSLQEDPRNADVVEWSGC